MDASAPAEAAASPEAVATPRAAAAPGVASRPAPFVIHVSIDGLRPDAVEQHRTLPAFDRLRAEGAWTHNARTDADYRLTLPNHAAQFTGRPVLGHDGHGWTRNSTPEPDQTLHTNKGHYVASVFDVAHDRGRRTALYASKSKFVLFDRSYDATHGAPDQTGRDDGQDKIDTFVLDADTGDLVRRFITDAQEHPYGYAFVHLRDPDAAGHRHGWDLRVKSPYMAAVRHADRLLGEILDLAASDGFAGRTAVIVTADHGGSAFHHQSDRPEHSTIPFYVWGQGVASGDLYAFNADHRRDPGEARPTVSDVVQPIRNGDAANLALALLGLDSVPGSTIGAAAPLRVRAPRWAMMSER